MTGVEVVEEDDAGDAQCRSGGFGFGRATLGQRLVGIEYAIADVAGAAAGGEDENDTMSGSCRPSQSSSVEKCLVVGMGMKGDQGPVGHLCILTGRRRGLP